MENGAASETERGVAALHQRAAVVVCSRRKCEFKGLAMTSADSGRPDPPWELRDAWHVPEEVRQSRGLVRALGRMRPHFVLAREISDISDEISGRKGGDGV